MQTTPQQDMAPTPWTFDGEMVRDANGRRVWDVEDANDNPEVAALTRCIHYVGFRDDRYLSAWRVFGGPRIIHRRWDMRAQRDIGDDDLVIFANGDETQPVSRYNGDDLTEQEGLWRNDH